MHTATKVNKGEYIYRGHTIVRNGNASRWTKKIWRSGQIFGETLPDIMIKIDEKLDHKT